MRRRRQRHPRRDGGKKNDNRITPSTKKLVSTMEKCRNERANPLKNSGQQNEQQPRLPAPRMTKKQMKILNDVKVKSTKKPLLINNNLDNTIERSAVENEYDRMRTYPAKAISPFFNHTPTSPNDEAYTWEPCIVHEYSPSRQRFKITFPNHDDIPAKWVQRLNLQFNDDEPHAFESRKKQTQEHRQLQASKKEYDALIDSQPDSLVAPIENERLKGILHRVSTDTTTNNKPLLSSLLTEARSGYMRAMKQAAVDTTNATTNNNIVVSQQQQEDEIHFHQPQTSSLQQLHWCQWQDAPQVLLALHSSLSTTDLLFSNDIKTPITLYEFQDYEDDHAIYQRDKIIAEWRSNVVNQIRDRMSRTFNLFVTDVEQYNGTKFQRFVKLVNCMMRTQLSDLVCRSIRETLNFLRSNMDTSIFKFKMATRENEVIFMPSLDMLEVSLCNLVDFPSKLSTICEIDTEVAPLMGFLHIPMIRPESTPQIYECLNHAKTIIHDLVVKTKEAPLALASKYQAFELKSDLKTLQTITNAIDATSETEMCFPFFTIDCSRVKEELIAKTKVLQTSVLEKIAENARQQNHNITEHFNEMLALIQQVPLNAHELHELKQNIIEIEANGVPTIQKNIRSMQKEMYIMESMLYPVSKEDFDLSWQVVRYPQLLQQSLRETKVRSQQDTEKFLQQLEHERAQLYKDLRTYREEVQVFVHYGSGSESEMEEYSNSVSILRQKLDEAQKKVQSFSDRDELFGNVPKSYEELDQLCKEFEPYYQLWHTTALFQNSYIRWMTGPFVDLQYERIEHDIDRWYKLMHRLEKNTAPEPARVAAEMRDKILEFKNHLPYIRWLRTPALRPRHWKRLEKVLNYNFESDDVLTLNQLLKLPLANASDSLEELCYGAEKEYTLEQTLEKMRYEWKHINLDVQSYVLKSSEDITQLLDDQIMKTQAMRGSPYITPFEHETKLWESRLQQMSQIMEEWLMFQKTWLYLEPIFGSEDIMRQMPQEGRRFGVVDQYWKKSMETAKRTPNALDFLETDSLLKGFQECNKMLDLIAKGLNDYLETKRLAFPRFFFLSNDELLNILSQTKNPTAVQPHLNKCFDAIHTLDFNDKQQICAMNSIEGEKIMFPKIIDPNVGVRKGNVEIWLKEVEDQMRNSLRVAMLEAMKALKMKPRNEWILEHAGQVVLAISQIEWTNTITTILANKTNNNNNGGGGVIVGLREYASLLDKQLLELVALVRNDTLSSLNRITLSALVTIDVHARDVVNDMIKHGVSDLNNFEWLRQLRYYYNYEQNDDIRVSMINTALTYAYEYLGNTPRLVITPLTDRAYATLMSAVHLHLGGAPEGPAGTGKTETVKDLAKALAIQCVVFNCSDGLDYLAMGKFFKGLASSGAWSCFDEFNRIQLEVLSVISQQISTIQRAIVEGRKTFFFENVNLSLVPSCSVFITMNPGYAGRAELPDNLKALFRTVAMMIPDYALIAEIILYSYGYNNARILAQKIVSCLKLASEQLSSQDHYDFGMRNLKAILTAAGNLKKQRTPPHHNNESDDDVMMEEMLCLYAINECNIPKFTSADIPLFRGITQDLFPSSSSSSDTTNNDDDNIKDALIQACTTLNLTANPNFITKCMELHETINVRHGLMLVGNAFSAKSTCIRTLALALGGDAYVKVQYINPKAVTRGQLYGEFDENTHEWTDGVLPPAIRTCTPKHANWIVFDGPVDAIWIEDMNTSLDDNKKLCLASGEIIKIQNRMNFIFEVADLSVASPATVSRCGMVYMEPNQLGWMTLIQHQSEKIRQLFEQFVPSCLNFMHSIDTSNEFVLNDLTLVTSTLRMFSILDAGNTAIDDECHVIFALIWSFGCTLSDTYRPAFSDMIHSLKLSLPIPERGTVFDYMYVVNDRAWRQWEVEKLCIPKNAKLHQIVVPTMDTVRNSWLLERLIHAGKYVCFIGTTGTGKTTLITNKILNDLPKTDFVSIMMSFSARTNANQTQDLIDSRLERRRHGILGPPLYKKALIFIDDLNMPAREKYGAQPPLELLRQWMNYGGWYDRQTNTFKQLVDIQFIGAMVNTNGGISERLQRHYHNITLIPYCNDSLHSIFGTIMQWHMKNTTPKLVDLCQPLVAATVDMYSHIMKHLLPTPSKSHYTFNLRDLGKVFEGICAANTKTICTKVDLVRLWCHEMQRTFFDRLVDDDDTTWFTSTLQVNTEKHFFINIEDYDSIQYSNVNESTIGKYMEVINPEAYKNHLVSVLNDYNISEKHPMNLVLFPTAVKHITRIARIIGQSNGHALLVGVGGSGKQSLTKLASYMLSYELYQVDVHTNYTFNEWRDDIRTIMKRALRKPLVFLLSDTQIRTDSFIEDVNNIINDGEVPNLFPADELMQLLEELKPEARRECQADSFSTVYAYFIRKIRANIHIVLCLSPKHPKFRMRLRQFPSLVNCCTIDWFQPWSNKALCAVGKRLLVNQDDHIIRMCSNMQTCISALSRDYEREMKRYNYVTPTSYLQLLHLFQHLLEMIDTRISSGKRRYETGLTKLEETEAMVVQMQAKIEKLQPELIQSTEETVGLMKTIELQSNEVESTRKIVSVEEKACNIQANAAHKIRDECSASLAEAMPILESALKALRVIRKQDLVELKSMKAPPSGVILTVQALCIMLGVPPVREGPIGKRVDNYWEAGKRSFLRDTHFITNLESFDKDDIPPDRIAAIRPLLKSNDFVPQKIAKSSKACEGFCKWVRAMEVYDRVAKMIRPKREALAEADGKLEVATNQLNAKKQQLFEIQEKLDDLQRQLNKASERKADLEHQVNECQQRLERAEKLIGGLGGEKERWHERSLKLQEDHKNITSSVIISAGIIAYLGVFTHDYRQRAIKQWCMDMKMNEDNFKLHEVLSSKIELREWTINGLPKDDFSYDNAVILKYSQRYSLLIDPQAQATRWLKSTYNDNNTQFQVIKANDQQFVRQIQNAVQFGLTILIEGVGEEVDSLLDPLLQKQFTYDVGGVRKHVCLAGESIEFHDSFHMILITKLANPKYTPETTTKVTLINFMVTQHALEDQMLNIVVSHVDPDLERQRGELIIQNAENQKQLSNIEDKILTMLNESQGMILDDVELITTLQKSKVASLSIEKRMTASKKTEDRINKFRGEYQSVATSAARMYFCMVKMSMVDSMYQFSLRWYIESFVTSIQLAEHHPKLKVHTSNIESTFTKSLYHNICRSLFEDHKLLFSFLLCLAKYHGIIPQKQLRFLLSNGSNNECNISNPAPQWLSNTSWYNIAALVGAKNFTKNVSEWYTYWCSNDPVTAVYPNESYGDVSSGSINNNDGDNDQNDNDFYRLLVLKCLRPDKLVQGIQQFVSKKLGQYFISPPQFNLNEAYNHSTQCTPLLFILSPGIDPSTDVYKLAEEKGFHHHIENISLGQGQGPIAEHAIREAVDKGTWVLLENCHLAVTWLPTLERIVDELHPDTTNPQFRLWLTSKPTRHFPASLLQECIKMTNEPPRGVKANLLRNLSSVCETLPTPMMYKLLLFHALVVERRQFGPLGWNIPYDFTKNDLMISCTQMKQLNEDRVGLEYLIGELNYGGRVTDYWDRRTLKHILKSCFDDKTPLGYVETVTNIEELLQHIEETLPLNDHPNVFGMHENAATTSAIVAGKRITDTIQLLQPRHDVDTKHDDGDGGGLDTLVSDLLARLPCNFNINDAEEKYPVDYANSMNTVLVQELGRYNRLLTVIRDSLLQLQSALKGEIVMTNVLECMIDQLYMGKVPDLWQQVSYPSLKPLMSWIVDLNDRIAMFQQWIDHGAPGVYWISGFFFTQSFLTGTLQNYARRHRVPIDTLAFEFQIMSHISPDACSFEAPADGCYIHGLYLQGAGFAHGQLIDESVHETYTTMPVIYLKPVVRTKDDKETTSSNNNYCNTSYACPTYKTTARAGTLSTTGHSTNFILSINLPTDKDESFWIQRGTALFTQLDS